MSTAENQNQQATTKLNTDYLKSRIGILRIAEGVIGICGIISESEGAYCRYFGIYSYYHYVVTTTLILSIIILVVYALRLEKQVMLNCLMINWPLTLFLHDIVFAILYGIAAILMFVTITACRYAQVARIFASIFGVIGTIVLGLLAHDGYKKIQATNQDPPPYSENPKV